MNPSTAFPFSDTAGPDLGRQAAEATASTCDALPPGATLDEFELRSVLEERESGIAYLAIDRALRRDVVVREYFPGALARRGGASALTPLSEDCAEPFSRGLAAFLDEARMLAGIAHPALPGVHRAWEANGTAYVAMPFVEGVRLDVARAAMTRPPDEAWLRALLLPLLDALELLHDAGRYDWEVSPQSILLLADGRPMLFGGAAAAQNDGGDPERTQPIVPAPAFAPIERCAGMSRLPRGPWTSLYALAAVAYYCVGGQPPLPAVVRAVDDPLEPLFEVVDRLGRRWPQRDYSVAFVSTIERALRVRPQERLQSVDEFRSALLGGRGYGTAPEELGAEPREWSGHGRFDATAGDPFADHAADDGLAGFGAPSAHEPWPPLSASGREPGADTALPAAAAPEAPPRVLGPEGGGNRGASDDRKAPGRGRALFSVFAALALLALGVGGGSMWTEYRDANILQRSLSQAPEAAADAAPAGEPAASPAPAQPPAVLTDAPHVPPSTSAADRAAPAPLVVDAAAPIAPAGAAGAAATPADGAKTADLQAAPPPSNDSPTRSEAAPAEAVPSNEVASVVAAPQPPASEPGARETTPPEPPAVTESAVAPPPAKLVRKEPDNPRLLCAPRTRFALYRCMTLECERPRYREHPECRYLRATDEVRPLQ
ncbi:MAG: serine/threonine protein kinase [Rhodocyclaceae bacterium]|nr:serine/threonine protein kinase [Rhodocyclaceae bacterium]